MTLQEPDWSFGIKAVNGMHVNGIIPFSDFNRNGQDSGVTSPESAEVSRIKEKPKLCLRQEPQKTLGQSSDSLICDELDAMSQSSVSDDPVSSLGKVLVVGGPGFAIGLYSPNSGDVERIPVSATGACSLTADPYAFATSSIISHHTVGDSQLWFGADQGTLHIFDYQISSNDLLNHQYIDLRERAVCISSRLVHRESESREEVDVVVGTPHGYLVVLTGPANSSGGLAKPLSAKKHVIRLHQPNARLLPSQYAVSAIACVSNQKDELFWCICGDRIVVLNPDTWKRINEMIIPPLEGQQPSCDVKGLLQDSEVGVWCMLSTSSVVNLWNKDTFDLEANVKSCSLSLPKECIPETNVAVMAYAHPYLFMGTNGGHLMVFEHIRKRTDGREQKGMKFAAAEGLEFDLLKDIHVQVVETEELQYEILVIGEYSEKSPKTPGCSVSKSYIFVPASPQLSASLGPSPANRSPISDTPSLPSKPRGLRRNCSISSGVDFTSPIKLTLEAVSPSAANFLPLTN